MGTDHQHFEYHFGSGLIVNIAGSVGWFFTSALKHAATHI